MKHFDHDDSSTEIVGTLLSGVRKYSKFVCVYRGRSTRRKKACRVVWIREEFHDASIFVRAVEKFVEDTSLNGAKAKPETPSGPTSTSLYLPARCDATISITLNTFSSFSAGSTFTSQQICSNYSFNGMGRVVHSTENVVKQQRVCLLAALD